MLFTVAVLLGARPAHGQGTIVGIVEDSSGAPIVAASVRVSGTDFGVATDASGRFRFPSLPAKTWKLDIRRLGYAPINTEVDVRNGDTVSLSVMLLPSAVPIAPVVVTETDITPKLREVGFDRRRKLLTTVPARQFVTRAQIEKQNPMRLSQVLDRMGKRCTNPVMYIDGGRRAAAPTDPPPPPTGRGAARIGQPMPRGLPVDEIPPSWIEGLEVYVGWAQIPLEYRPPGRDIGCVLLIWTRSGY